MKIKLSDESVKLVLIVLIIAVLGLAYYGNTKISEMNTQTEAQITTLRSKYNDLTAKNNEREHYMQETDKSKALYTGIMNKYANGLDQEHMIMNLKIGEDLTGLWVKNVTLAGVSSVYTFGNVTSSNPARVGEKVYISDNIGVSSVLNINYEGTYEQLKNFISYINDAEDKSKINNVTMAYSASTNVVTGTMQLTQYGIVGSKRAYDELVLKNVSIGTDNVFESETFIGSVEDDNYGQKIMVDYDLFLMLNSCESDVESVIVGQRDDYSGEKLLLSDNNYEEDVTIRISGKDGEYFVSYKIGNQTYPVDDYAEGVEFVCGETLDLLIISSTRADVNDRVGAKLQVVNNSDLVLNYKIVNEDEDDPRFNMGKVTGKVLGHN